MIDVSAAVFIFIIALAGVVLFLLGVRIGQGKRSDPLYPMNSEFRSWEDFVRRVARPMVLEEDKEREALDLYYKASPYFICVSMVMMYNRLMGGGQIARWVEPGDSTN